jgi:hypothetical protein
MHSNKMVAVIKVKGKVLRESGNVVYIPFGSDYSIQLKNLHTTKARVSIFIDGKDVIDGQKILVDAGATTELEGFLKNNNVKSKFRFIEKTYDIEDFRGNRIDDGLITINFEYEQTPNHYQYYPKPIYYDVPLRKTRINDHPCYPKIPYYGVLEKEKDHSNSNFKKATIYCKSDATFNDNGITVNGGDSNQHFINGMFNVSDGNKHSLIIHLKGKTDNNVIIEKPIEVQTKLQCTSCGKMWKSSNKYCGNCATRLL